MLLLLPPLLLAAYAFRRVRQRICRIGFLCALWCWQKSDQVAARILKKAA